MSPPRRHSSLVVVVAVVVGVVVAVLVGAATASDECVASAASPRSAADAARSAVRRHLHAVALNRADRKLATIDSSLLQVTDDAPWSARVAASAVPVSVGAVAAAARAHQWRNSLAYSRAADAVGDDTSLNMTLRSCSYVSLNCTNGGLMVRLWWVGWWARNVLTHRPRGTRTSSRRQVPLLRPRSNAHMPHATFVRVVCQCFSSCCVPSLIDSHVHECDR